MENPAPGGAMIFNQQHYHVGDFVYIQPQDRNAEPSIIHILRGWTNAEGIQMLYGDCFCRPNETYHVQTRKFLEKVKNYYCINQFHHFIKNRFAYIY